MTANTRVRTLNRRFTPFRFSLLTLLLAVAGICILLAALVQPWAVTVRARVQVKARPKALVGEPAQFDPQEYADFRNKLLQQARSEPLLTAAIRHPRVWSRDILIRQKDPIKWLQQNLVLTLPDDSEILTIELHGTEEDKDDLIAVLDSVVQTLVEQAATADRTSRQSRIDYKTNLSQELKEDIDRKAQSLSEAELRLLRMQLAELRESIQRDTINLKAESRVVLIQPATRE